MGRIDTVHPRHREQLQQHDCPHTNASSFAPYTSRVQATVLGIVLLLLAACGRVPTAPTAPSTIPGTAVLAPPVETVPTQPVPATDSPSIDGSVALTPSLSAPPPDDAATDQAGEPFTSPRYGYTVVLPCCWVALPAPATAVEAALSDLAKGTGDPLYDNLLGELREDEASISLEYIAYLPDANGLPEAQLTVSVMPAARLTLETYLDGVTAEIGGIGATAVVTSEVKTALGPNDTPAGVLEYTTVYEADPLHGLQIAFFTRESDHLIVLTFTTNAEKFDGLRAEFMQIVQSVTFGG